MLAPCQRSKLELDKLLTYFEIEIKCHVLLVLYVIIGSVNQYYQQEKFKETLHVITAYNSKCQ